MDKAPQGPSPILPRPKKSSKYPCGILKHKNSAHSTTHRTGLRKAISAASRRQLASLLYDACKQLEQMRELAALQLLAPEQNRQDVFETCRNCGEEYDVKMNQEHKDCVHHPGSREVDEESGVWEDHDPHVFGDAWTLSSHEDFAEGFLWSCSDAHVNTAGCTIERHKPVPQEDWKRLRQ